MLLEEKNQFEPGIKIVNFINLFNILNHNLNNKIIILCRYILTVKQRLFDA